MIADQSANTEAILRSPRRQANTERQKQLAKIPVRGAGWACYGDRRASGAAIPSRPETPRRMIEKVIDGGTEQKREQARPR